jgi:prepilin peptidase CpaA
MPLSPNPALADIVLVITAAVLFYAAVTDLRQYRIPNELVLLLIALFAIHAVLAGRLVELGWNLALAAIVFAALVFFYSRRWVGGGDVKILTVAFLWIGVDCALPFAILLFLFAMLHAIVAKLGWVGSQEGERSNERRIAFAPAVAAAMISAFILGCLRSTA